MNDKQPENLAQALTPTPDETEDAASFFRGTVVRVTYYSEDSGFGVLKAEPEYGTRDPQNINTVLTTIVGVFPPTISSGSYFIARGEWHTHPKFGRQFKAQSITEADPTGKEAIERYLASGAIKGFGPVLAKRVIEHLGEEVLQIIDNNPDRLLEVPGIGKKKLREILDAWQKKRNIREVLLFFQNHGISLSLAQRIYQAYGDKAIEIVSKNPYALAHDVWGIGFLTADTIARALGTDLKSKERVIAGIAHTLAQATDDGHCYLPQDMLLAKSASLLQLDDEDLLRSSLGEASLRGDLIADAEHIYLPSLFQAESQLARCIAQRLAAALEPSVKIAERLVETTCEQAQLKPVQTAFPAQQPAQNQPIIRLSDQQKEAVRYAAHNSLLIITGGPGCGKTTVVRTIAQLFRRAGLGVKLAAPTGRAAQRLAELCGMPASTIHRLLHYDPTKRAFLHNQHNLLPLDALIVDESSMIDIPLATSLFRATPPNARVVVVGDADQLPSVGPGLFLGDLLKIAEIPRVRLTMLFRRADESLITGIAHQINSAVVPEIPEPDGATKTDAYFLPAPDAEAAAALIERLTVEQIPKKFGFSGSDITVLSPVNQGVLGINALNKRLQQRLIPPVPGLPSVKVGDLEFRHGDRVVQRVNNYNIHPSGVFNGDQGEVIGIDANAKSIYVRLWDGREIEYEADVLDQLDLAYALTIHRSQGCEVPVVILALHDSHNIMLERQLIYTAVTRAKRLLVIVGTKRALAIATKRSRSKRRYTELTGRVVKYLAKSA
jgi:exodeoxyribonuclease V alpha subunit